MRFPNVSRGSRLIGCMVVSERVRAQIDGSQEVSIIGEHRAQARNMGSRCKESGMAEAIGGGKKWRGGWRRSGAMGMAGGLGAYWWNRLAAGKPETSVVLGEAMRPGSTSRVRIELKAQGLFRPGLPPGAVAAEATMPKPLALDVQTRLVYSERVLELVEDEVPGALRTGNAGAAARARAEASGRARKVARHV